MNIPRFFIDRPRFATVLSTVVLLVGGLSYFELPVSQYPEVATPTVVVTASYPGATPETIAQTVATPLEQEINGVEDMIYMESQSTVDGVMTLTVTFELGTDVDKAQVLVQNRVNVAEPRLPAEVRQIGVTTQKSSPDLLMVVHMLSPDDSLDQLYISNYAFLQIRDQISRLDGVGDVRIFGGSQYSMRVWLDIERLASLDLTSGDVLAALREQNIQVAAGALGQEPTDEPGAFQVTVSSQGRLENAQEFEQIIIKSGRESRLVRLGDVARVELGAQDYAVRSYLGGRNAVAMVIFQRPGSNAIDTANQVIRTVERLSSDFPRGLEHRIVYNPTQFVEDSIREVFKTLLIAASLVVLTVFVFLQDWRTTIIPVVAIPISLIGTFAIMSALGVSLNSLSLFGLVLAIGIVVDDAIVVVENVERLLSSGLSPKQAARQAMDEVASALVATTVVLIAVFVPTAFISGLSGQFYKQFALTIAASTAISTFVSLTLSPALSAVILRPSDAKKRGLDWVLGFLLGWFFWLFNRVFDKGSQLYARVVSRALKWRYLMLLLFVGLMVGTYFGFQAIPGGFIPPQDQGYLILAVQLPEGASLDRTDAVVKQVSDIARDTPGIANAVAFTGFSGATRVNSTNAAAIFTPLDDAGKRAAEGLSADVILAELRARLGQVEEGMVLAIPPPPVPGIGTGGGFKMQIQDRGGAGFDALNQAAWQIAGKANQVPGMVQVFSTFSTGAPQLYADIDRTKAQILDVPIASVNEALQVYLGSVFVNDFNYLGRVYRVTAQADAPFRNEEEDILRLKTRSATGAIVPLGSLLNLERRAAPARVVRYNLYPAADVTGDTLPWFSTGQALEEMERIARETLPQTMDFEWTDLAYQAKTAGNTAVLIFALCVLLAFLALTAQYESWSLPLVVVLIVPLCLSFGLLGVFVRGLDNNILVQIGFVLLVGLACKNAILIVEFAKEREQEGDSPFDAVVEACKLRLRPILMTAFSFILGVLPLVFARGAGSEMRQALGTAVFSGMVGVTIFGMIMTPVFYLTIRKLVRRGDPESKAS